jgi:hypothetical protein
MMKTGTAWTTLYAINNSFTYNWSIRAFVSEGGASRAIAYEPIEEIPFTTEVTDPFLLSYTEPVRTETRALTGYKVYRNGELQATYPTTIRTHTDLDVPNGAHTYGVTAVYSNGASNPATVNVTVYNITSHLIYDENFEGFPDFATTFAPWTLRDQDNALTYGFEGIEFPGSEGRMAYMIFNPSATVPPITTLSANSGSKMVAAFVAQDVVNNDWLITPRIQLGTQSALRFFARSHTAQYGLERFRVGVSTLPTILLPGFQYISGGEYTEAPTTWTEYAYDLSTYDNQNVWIAIRCVSDDAFVFYVDDFQIYSNGVSNDDPVVPVLQTELKGNYPTPSIRKQPSALASMRQAR